MMHYEILSLFRRHCVFLPAQVILPVGKDVAVVIVGGEMYFLSVLKTAKLSHKNNLGNQNLGQLY